MEVKVISINDLELTAENDAEKAILKYFYHEVQYSRSTILCQEGGKVVTQGIASCLLPDVIRFSLCEIPKTPGIK